MGNFAVLSLGFCGIICLLITTASTQTINFDAIVAQDGSGNYTHITDAIAAAPVLSQKRYYIRIKPGVYKERVEVWRNKTLLALIGDDAATTIITFNRSAKQGYTDPETATLSVDGVGFIAKYLTIENTAGAEAGQAIALHNNANHSAFYRCIFLGFQDTLYAHGESLLQFYKDCDIYGSVDFIFGQAKAVFQDCRIYARLENKTITVTAQGKNTSTMASGFSFQHCNVTAAPVLQPIKSRVKAYLGRPWGLYSTVVFMESFFDVIVLPEGWLAWDKKPYLFYAEYKNYGPGSDTSQRVKWPGYQVFTEPPQAEPYTVAQLIDGNAWIPETGIPYVAGLNE